MEHVELNNGRFIPTLGLGFGFLQTKDEGQLFTVIERALDLGYRHFDTAFTYGNEHILGKVFKKWIDDGRVTRDQLFVTSKLPTNGNDPSRVRHFLELSLKALQLDYVDLYLIHWPIGHKYLSDTNHGPDGLPLLDTSTDLEALWREMEVQVKGGLAKSIGISNFAPNQVLRMIKAGEMVPALLQVEAHAYFQQKELRTICSEFNIAIAAFGTLGSLSREEKTKATWKGASFKSPLLLHDPIVRAMAEKYCRTPAQILLRHLLQLKIIPVTSTSNSSRLAENYQVFDFELESGDMEKLNNLDKGEKGRSFTATIFPPGTHVHPEFPFKSHQ